MKFRGPAIRIRHPSDDRRPRGHGRRRRGRAADARPHTAQRAAGRCAAHGTGWTFEAELDGAPGPGGTGLWDSAARVRWALAPGWSVAAGLRHLRGGVDNDELYNVVSTTSATLSARWAF
ncbi:MAG: hypothetical protein O9345_18385 [Burkholderiaceae bacterium]|jgi:hypothetical protein|nr:hypothetical protein [Burkholderiales bacterium]MCZ8105500.1 hypothetical protein [Burkholderiales bacterium]MCZ8340091.1 hypothetical protein [Burkholderiaceae bacterium]